MNKLYYGDNLKILRDYIHSESIDLVYLDPPFNSNRNYNVLFKDESGREAEAQITAFEDTWHWSHAAEQTYHQLVTAAPDDVSKMIAALRQFIGTNQMMAYIVMITARLVELHRVLKSTGSLYLHCDTTASHYLKIILDTIFGVKNFRNEITWKRSSAHSDTKQGMKRCGKIRDVLFFYSKSSEYTWNPQYTPYTQEYLESEYRHVAANGRRYKETDLTAAKPGGETEYEWRVKKCSEENAKWEADLTEEYKNPKQGFEYLAVTPYQGRYWAYSKSNLIQFAKSGNLIHRKTGMPRLVQFSDEMPGIPLQDLWDDIPPSSGNEHLGYPTQKPIALLERIVAASSNEGETVLDPFAGCGTTIAAAQKLKRNWIGIDVTQLSVALLKNRLAGNFKLEPKKDYEVIGEPEDLQSARQLALDDRYQFQWWALSLIKARPLGGAAGSKTGKKGSDKGIDGVITFVDDNSGKPKRILVQVKSGKVSSRDIRDLVGTITREESAIGVFITLENSTRDMTSEAASAGFYHSSGWNKDFPRLQIFTIEELLKGADVKMPPSAMTFKQAQRIEDDSDVNFKLPGM